MPKIAHRLKHHIVDAATKFLILGTFNPETKRNKANFFYATGRNDFWKLVPTAFGSNRCLKSYAGTTNDDLRIIQADRERLMRKGKFDFMDIIAEVDVPNGAEHYRGDKFLDNHVSEWAKVEETIVSLKHIEAVAFTRRTLSDVRHIRKRVDEIRDYCNTRGVAFCCLISPSRLARGTDKQAQWTTFFNSKPS